LRRRLHSPERVLLGAWRGEEDDLGSRRRAAQRRRRECDGSLPDLRGQEPPVRVHLGHGLTPALGLSLSLCPRGTGFGYNRRRMPLWAEGRGPWCPAQRWSGRTRWTIPDSTNCAAASRPWSGTKLVGRSSALPPSPSSAWSCAWAAPSR